MIKKKLQHETVYSPDGGLLQVTAVEQLPALITPTIK